MRSEIALRILAETPEDVKENVRKQANAMVKNEEKTTTTDMTRIFEYVIDKNPTQDKIDRIKASIERQRALGRTE